MWYANVCLTIIAGCQLMWLLNAFMVAAQAMR